MNKLQKQLFKATIHKSFKNCNELTKKQSLMEDLLNSQ